MPALTLHFDFSRHPLDGDPDMSGFRHELAVGLESVLRRSGNGRWRGGRYSRGVVTIFLEVADVATAMRGIDALLAEKGLLDRLTVRTGSSHA